MVEAGILCQDSRLKPTGLHSFLRRNFGHVAGMKVCTPSFAVCAGSKSIQRRNAGHSGLISVQVSNIRHPGLPNTLCFLEACIFHMQDV